MFYPQLVAGPIERPQNLLHQFYDIHVFSYREAVSGLQLMAWGLFKKIVIADRLAILVNRVYDSPHGYTGLPLIVATWAFAFQIFCDFSGYSDIAIGAARVMGFRLMLNFRQPYLARSVGEFWKRWHISLSTWFRDYLYIPLGGNRVTRNRQIANIMTVFLISGLWHGASWNFVVWGGLNGMFIVAEMLFGETVGRMVEALRIGPGTRQVLQVFITFNLICVAWIFFRAASLADALYILEHLIPGPSGGMAAAKSVVGSLELAFAAFLMLLVTLMHVIQERYRVRQFIASLPTPLRWSTYYGCTAALLLLAQFGTGQQFIYFQF